MERNYLPLCPDYFHRSRMQMLLEKATQQALVTIVAGPGYGKTQAAAGFAKHTRQRLVWLGFLEQDNDPAQFWKNFTHAVHREMPHLAQKLAHAGFPETAAQHGAMLRLFAGEIYADSPVLLVLDDYDNLASPAVPQFFDDLFCAGLENTTIMLTSNKKLPFGGFMPAKGQFRITSKELAFTPSEAYTLLAATGMHLTEKEAERITEITGGWPLALHIIGAGGTEAGTAPGLYLHMAAELFEEQFYAGYPETIRHALIGLALLPAFPLEVVAEVAPGEVEQVAGHLGQNPYITYDYTTRLYVFQQMYREFLQRKQAFLSAEEANRVHLAAGHWYAAQNRTREAMRCFAACGCYAEMLDALCHMPMRRHTREQAEAILALLEEIPAEYAKNEPMVDFCRAFFMLNGLQIDKAQTLFWQLVNKLENSPEPASRQMLGEIYIALSDISILQNGTEAVALIRRAAALLPTGSKLRNRGVRVAGNHCVFALPACGAGTLTTAVDGAHEYARYGDKLLNGSGYGMEWLFAAEAAFNAGQIDLARERCHQAIQKADVADQYDIIGNAYWLLTRIAVYRGSYAEVTAVLDELDDYVQSAAVAEMTEFVDCTRGWFGLRMGDSASVAPWLREVRPPRYAPLDVGRSRLLTAYYLLEDGRPEQASAVLTGLELVFAQRSLWTERVIWLVLQATRLLSSGQSRASADVFHKACLMLHGNDLYILLVEFGKSMLKLIENVRFLGLDGFDMDWLDKVYTDALSYAKRLGSLARAYSAENHTKPPASPTLTKRETEVLNYLAQGLTRDEIARMMDISVNGVKKHVAKIYMKLGAVNRADAIHTATVEGLVDPL